MKIRVFFLALLILAGCAAGRGQTGTAVVSADNLGRKITVEGWAVNSKIGARLIGIDFDLWIDGLSSWPEGYYTGGARGKKVMVSGVLARDSDLPVFIPKKDESIVQGIPVPEGTDLRKARQRYILKNAEWKLLQQ